MRNGHFHYWLKRSVYWVVGIVTLAFLPNAQVQASHFAAADLQVDYVGESPTDLRYKLTLTLYRACDLPNAQLSDFETIRYGFGGTWAFTSGSIAATPRDTLDQLCPNFKDQNSCRLQGSPYPGFIRRVYDTIITLPARRPDWRFYWTSGTRNGNIVNLQNPGSANIYVEAGLDNAIRYDNNSPRFFVDPVPYLCANQPAYYLNGPLDPNGDSLEVVSQIPFTQETVQATYAGGYSLANPIASLPGNPYQVNPSTAT